MNLGDLRAFVGTALDYEPDNETYREQLNSLINAVQKRLLTDRPWDFSQKEASTVVYTDETHSITVTNGSVSFSGTSFSVSTDAITPGSKWDGAKIEFTDSTGNKIKMRIAWMESTILGHFTTLCKAVSGTYTATIKMRDIPLPADTQQIMAVSDLTDGQARPQTYLTKAERDLYTNDVQLLGTPSTFVPSQSIRVPAPRSVSGVSTATPGAGQGVRTLNIYMVNVINLKTPSPNVYGVGVAGGLESGLSRVYTVTLTDTEELSITPETLNDSTGLYRRYYFTCPDEGIYSPVRLVQTTVGSAGVDTISPAGGVTLSPDTSVATLQTQLFESESIRYMAGNGAYQTFQLYPHPSAQSEFRIRRLVSPEPMLEDQDTPLIPDGFSQIIAYAALEEACLKHDAAPLAGVYAKKASVLFRGMEQRFLGAPPRRIVKGGMNDGPPSYPKITFTP